MKLLVVEDSAELRGSLVRSLVAAGYIVEEADNGEDAAHLGSTGDYDAIILDLGLPVRRTRLKRLKSMAMPLRLHRGRKARRKGRGVT